MNRIQRIAERLVARDEGGMDPLALQVAEFLKDNPNPDDKAFHDWAEKEGVDVHLAEAGAYRLATLASNFLFGGNANEKGFETADADPAELAMGIEIEKEHSPDISVRARIALDHLAEIPDYYTRLKEMEEEAGVED